MAQTVAQRMGTPRFAKPILRASSESNPNTDYCTLTAIGGSAGGGKIILPLPVNIASNTNATWEQADAGLMAHMAQGKPATNTAKDMIAAGLAETDRRAIEMIASGILGSGGSQAYQKRVGSLINPAKENYFRGSECRSIQLTFNLIPLNKEDTNIYHDAIVTMQENSVPSVPGNQTGRIMKYPASWHIQFKPSKYLPHYKEAVLTNMSMDYSATGKTYLHDGGGPVQINLTLNFTELTILTYEDILGGIYG